ncbi:MAG: type II toxin-antitoxin system RelE/ParE family toxin [Treponema sp.]|nr:type II toxin-antitoxin system RelE/ParE family toxin [Treponema sp.]
MRIFKTTWFTRFAGKEGILDSELRDMVNRLEAGQADADLGGGVYKLRVARTGDGKRGGYRVIVFFKSGDRTFYVYGFTKSNRGNISNKELKAFKESAKEYFSITTAQLKERIEHGQLIELQEG